MKKINKLTNIVLILSLVLTVLGRNFEVNAEDNNGIECTNTNVLNLVNNNGEESTLLEKLEYDAENNITQLPEDIEEELNEVGVFDSEIEQLDEYTIDKLEDSINTQVSVIYYKTNEKTGKQEEMEQEEVDNIIEENIQEGVYEYQEEENLVSKIFTKIGLKPIEVKAAKASDTDYSPSKAVKSVLICTQEKKEEKLVFLIQLHG